ncbi:AAA family ATPase [Candidatus Bipolaricaulota bacterium]|nr:AAA family ATPase [Candidatus Bipolaricaulota bacterium]
MITERQLDEATLAFGRLREAISDVIVGHEEIVSGSLIALLCGGNLLLEGVPGLGKTLLVRTLASALGLSFSRIQFTPDLMPADIVGTDILTEENGHRGFSFSAGPVFAHIVLADEVNRATPKTQSALLEAMEERTVTVGRVTHPLEEPFMVLATENPIEMEGTYPLPEAQVDRFLMKLEVHTPTEDELVEISRRNTEGQGIVLPDAVASREDILSARAVVREIPVGEGLRKFVARLVLATHAQTDSAPQMVKDYVEYGASPRAAIAILQAAKAHAFLAGEPNVRVRDVEVIHRAALVHRVLLNFRGDAEGIDVSDVISDVWRRTRVS